MSEEEKPEKIKYGRHKPGWGRVFSEGCPYQDDAIYWKLYDITMLRNPRAVFEIKAPHRIRPNSNNKGRKRKDGSDEKGRANEEVRTSSETLEKPIQPEQEITQSH